MANARGRRQEMRKDKPRNGTKQTTDVEKADPHPWIPKFLEQLVKSPNVSSACAVAGIGRTQAYDVKKAMPAFSDAWEDARDVALDAMEEKGMEMATRGESPVLTIFFLKHHRPELYGDTVAVTGPDGGPVTVSLSGMVHLAESARKKRLLAAGETLLEEVVDGEYQEVE